MLVEGLENIWIFSHAMKMKPARQTFYVLSGVGIFGSISVTWEKNQNASYYHSSQISETIKEVFSFAGVVDNVLVPVLFAGYASFVVWLYYRWVTPRTPSWNKWVRIFITLLFGLIFYIALLGAFIKILAT